MTYKYGVFLIASLLSLSLNPALAQQADNPSPSPTTATADQRNTPDPRQAAMAELAKSQSPDTEVLWLETQLESFLGLYHPANSANPKGAALILHHDRTSPDWPEMIHNIRTSLPDQQWHTLSIAMPEEPQPKIPLRADNNQADANQTASAEPNSFNDKVFERIDAGLQRLSAEQPDITVIIGVGSGAYWASSYLSGKTQDRNLLLVLIDARPPLHGAEPTLAEAVAKVEIPTADIVHSGLAERKFMQDQATKRINQAKRDGRQYYLHRSIPGRPTAREGGDTMVLNLLKGLLKERLLKMSEELMVNDASGEEQKPPGG